MRRILLILLFCALGLSACAPTVTLLGAEMRASPTVKTPDQPLVATPSPVPSPTRPPDLGIKPDALKGVEVLIWNGLDGVSASLFAKLAAEFSLSNKWGIQARVASQGNLNQLAVAVDKALGSPTQPDVVLALPEQILAWQDKVVDLSPYVAQPEFGLDALDTTGAFWEQSNLGGVRYAIPAARSARFLFYNQSFARDLGFNLAPSTSAEFREQACAANAFWKQDADLTNDGYGGLVLDVSSNWQTPYAWLVAGGGQVFLGGGFHFNTPENVTALELISSLRADGCAWQSASSANYEHFAARRALFITGSLGEIAAQQAAFSAVGAQDQWTLLAFPGERPAIVAYGVDYAILKSNPARQMAGWLFMGWMLEPQNQARWSHGTGLLPVTLSAQQLLSADAAAQPQRKAALALIKNAVIYPQSASWRLADKLLADGFLAYANSYPNTNWSDVLSLMDATISDLIK